MTDIITTRIAGCDFSASPLTGHPVTKPVDLDGLLHSVGEVLDGL